MSIGGPIIAFAGPGDGPRSFPLLPKNLNLITVYALAQDGDQLLSGQTIPDADFDIYVGIWQYTRTFRLYDHLGAVFVAVPYAHIDGDVPRWFGGNRVCLGHRVWQDNPRGYFGSRRITRAFHDR